MPNYNVIEPNKLTIERLSKLANDIVSNQRLDDDVYTHDYENIKRFDFEHHAVNRHDRRAIKAKYNKFKKRKK